MLDLGDQKAAAIVKPLLGAAARRGEMAVAIARITTGAAVVILWPVFQWPNLIGLVPRTLSVLIAGWIAVIWSCYVLFRIKKNPPTEALMLVSITIDALAINAMLLTYVFDPAFCHDSIVEVHGSAIVYLTIVMAGARLSVPAALWGACFNSACLIGIVVLSTVRVDNWKIIGPVEWITVLAGLLGATILAVSAAQRTKDLVFSAAIKAREAEKAVGKLGAYVSEEIASELLKHDELEMGGQRQNVAILFSDLRGFTKYSETLEPEELVRQLNQYLDAMVAAISSVGGVVDKYVGDAVMAVFGVPKSSADDASRSIEAARAMMLALENLNRIRAKDELPPLRQGIGIHYGPVVAGNVGTTSRASYTVIGDSVNLASRLETATKHHDVSVLISEQAVEQCGSKQDIHFVGEINVSGRDESVRVYSLEVPSLS